MLLNASRCGSCGSEDSISPVDVEEGEIIWECSECNETFSSAKIW
ncbi:MAG: hypothetical protein ABEK59_13350 [Halobacteria archaeon]